MTSTFVRATSEHALLYPHLGVEVGTSTKRSLVEDVTRDTTEPESEVAAIGCVGTGADTSVDPSEDGAKVKDTLPPASLASVAVDEAVPTLTVISPVQPEPS